MRRDRLHSFLCVWAAATVALGGCPAPAPVATPKARPLPPHAGVAQATRASGRATVPIDTKAGDDGKLVLRFGGPKQTIATATPSVLSRLETEALLARLEPLPAVDNAHAPVVRPPSAAPPKSGTIQPIAFVAPTGSAIVDQPVQKPPAVTHPLAKPEILPAGEVRAELELRVRFDEPMVPIDAVSANAPAIATITPPVAGSWRWLDTRVAGFFVTGPRFAQATDYTVTVPAGLTSQAGSVLGAPATGTFSTPPPAIAGTYPRGTLRPDAPIAVQLDQDVDPDAIAKHLRVETLTGKRPVAFTTTTLGDAKALWAKRPGFVLDEVQLGHHYVLLAPKTSWPAGTVLRVVLGTGAPSREGPRVSARESDAQVDIASPFKVLGIGCDDHEAPIRETTCSALSYVQVEFSNAIDPTSFRASKVQIAGGELEDHWASGSSVAVLSPAVPGRKVSIAIAPDLVDVFGQPLVGPRDTGFTTTRHIFMPELDAPAGLHVLDPRFEIPQWVVRAQAVTSLHVQLFQVKPADYFAWEAFEAGKRATPPGKRVHDKTYEVGDRFAATARLDLGPALASGVGHVVAVATATPAHKDKRYEMPTRVTAWIEVTKLGVVARLDGEKAHAWAMDISPAKFLAPIADASMALVVRDRADVPPPAKTDAAGLAVFDLPEPAAPKKPAATPIDDDEYEYGVSRDALFVVTAGADSAFTTISRHERTVRQHTARWYVTDDRFTYKPGEPVYVKGWVRWTHSGPAPGLEQPAAGDSVAYTLLDARGTKLGSGTAAFTAQGGFDFQVDIPANANLGRAVIQLHTRDQTYTHPIDIQEFRTPAYAVNLDDDVAASGALPLVLGESIEMNAEAKYYAGGGLPGAAITWNATLRAASYRPPGWDLYSFQPVRPRSEDDGYSYRHHEHSTSVEDHSSLSGASSSSVVLGMAALPDHEPSVLSVDATVTDVDRMTIRATSRSIIVHPSSYYVGMRLRPETLDTLQLVVTDIDGNAVAGVPIDVALDGTLFSEHSRDDAEIVDTQHCALVSAAEPVLCHFTPKDRDNTEYRAVAKVADARGRTNATAYRVPYWRPADTTRDLEISADRPSYKPGDVAKLTIHSAVVPASAVVTFARQGVIAQKRVELAANRTVVELPIEVSYIQNVHVTVDRWAKRRTISKWSPKPLPEHEQRSIDVPIDVDAARLVMRARPTRPLVGPGEDATFEVEVEHGDKPVAGAEVALLVVDEAVLALSGKQHADPLAPFYRAVADGTWAFDTLDLVRDAEEDLLEKPGFERINLDETGYGASGTGSGYGVGGGRGGMRGASLGGVSSTSVVTSRKDFRATAVWSPRLTTDARGRVTVTVKMPDSLTRFRVVALATASTYFFGKAESSIVTQRKVNARTVAPRFLTQGDRFELPVVVQNLDAKPRTVDVAVRAANLVAAGPAGQRVTIPPGQRAELRFGFQTAARGKVVIQTIATSGDFADASNVTLPVYEPATTESFATYGVVDDKPAFERLQVPGDIFPDVGGIETEVASTQMQSLTDAYWYLYAYPYECAEQRSSRMLATSALYDLLAAFNVPGRPTRQELDQIQANDVQKLRGAQNKDGGWGYWRDTPSDPFVTMQVVQALVAQHDRSDLVKRGVAYVTAQVAALTGKLEQATKPTARRLGDEAYLISLAATALATLAATGLDERAAAQKLDALAQKLAIYPVDAKARLLAIVAKSERAKPMRDRLVTELLSATHETAAGAQVAAAYTEGEKLLLVSSARTTALALDALMREVPAHPLVDKLARGLLGARARGRWRTTQENLAVVQALRHYFDTYEKDTPSYTGKLWVGTSAYAEQAFAGRSNARAVSQLDWSALAPGSGHDIALAKTGPGRMYYRIGITYAPKRVDLPPLDAGFIVRRSYEAVDDPGDVVKTKDGWRIKLGARVLVVLETVTSSERDQVALVDPLPAGLESVNTALAIAERAATGSDDGAWNHVEMRDNRSEAFAFALPPGTHRFSYTARATTPGTFIAAPTKAEEMYAPETFGRSNGAVVTVY